MALEINLKTLRQDYMQQTNIFTHKSHSQAPDVNDGARLW